MDCNTINGSMPTARSRMGRPSLYVKPHRTTIMLSTKARNELLPMLVSWLHCSKNDVIEAAIRSYYREQKTLRQKAAAYSR